MILTSYKPHKEGTTNRTTISLTRPAGIQNKSCLAKTTVAFRLTRYYNYIVKMSTQPALCDNATPLQVRAPHKIPLRWHYIVALHMSGRSVRAIAQETGLGEQAVRRILSHPDVQYIRQQLLASLDQEFEALWGKVISNLREQLDHEDQQIRLAAQNQWLKASGRYQQLTKQKLADAISAEDIVINILNGNVK
jgi:lambda repressor-like predicted transcriptional regulator